MAITRFRLQPMDLRDLLDESFELYRSGFALLVTLTAAVALPVFLVLFSLMGVGMATNEESLGMAASVLALGALLIGGIAFTVTAGAVTFALSELFLGRRVTFRQAYRAAYRRKGFAATVFLTALVIGAGEFFVFGLPTMAFESFMESFTRAVGSDSYWIPLLGFPVTMALLLVAAIFLCLWLLVAPVLMVEGRSGAQALQRSARLFLSSPWKTLVGLAALALVLMVISAALVAALMILPITIYGWFDLGSDRFQSLDLILMGIEGMLTALANALLLPIPLTFVVLLYYDIRIRREGFDLEVLADELGKGRTESLIDAPSA